MDSSDTATPRRTRLYEWHVAHGGRMVAFAGWELPVRYDRGVIEEHRLVRRSAGLFDIDHMGQFLVSGEKSLDYLQTLVTSDLATLAVGQSRYGLLCLPSGGVVDDVFVYRRPDDWMVVVNAANREKDWAWMRSHATAGVAIVDVSDETYMIALQGPRAVEILASVCSEPVAELARFGARQATVAGVSSYVGRTGYTGEDGFELFFPETQALRVWEALLAAGQTLGIDVGAIGLGARDSLRFEPGYSLYGHELREDITPLEAGLSWACDLTKSFIGQEALVAQKTAGVPRKIVAFTLTEPGVPREGCGVTDASGKPVGVVVAGVYAPTLDQSCGHALVDASASAAGTSLLIVIRDKPKAAVVARRPLYTRPKN